MAEAFGAGGEGKSAIGPEGGPNPPGAREPDGLRAGRPRGARAFGLLPWAALSTGLLVALAAASIATGSRLVPLHEVWDALFDFDPKNDAHLVVREPRLPRTFAAIMAGACLGLAGALAQSLTRNPLAEPGTLGISQGAASGVIVGLFVGRRILVGFSAFLRAGLLMVGELARFLVLAVFHRGSLGGLVLA